MRRDIEIMQRDHASPPLGKRSDIDAAAGGERRIPPPNDAPRALNQHQLVVIAKWFRLHP